MILLLQAPVISVADTTIVAPPRTHLNGHPSPRRAGLPYDVSGAYASSTRNSSLQMSRPGFLRWLVRQTQSPSRRCAIPSALFGPAAGTASLDQKSPATLETAKRPSRITRNCAPALPQPVLRRVPSGEGESPKSGRRPSCRRWLLRHRVCHEPPPVYRDEAIADAVPGAEPGPPPCRFGRWHPQIPRASFRMTNGLVLTEN